MTFSYELGVPSLHFVQNHPAPGPLLLNGPVKMIKLMADAVGEAAGVRRTGVWVYIAELPARQMIEYGYVLPEPGDEQVWTDALPHAMVSHN
jgi:hypothetical protein